MLTRRAAIAALLSAPSSEGACSVLLDLKTRRVVEVHRPDLASRWLVPPGSTLKPLSLTALLESGKMRGDERFLCPGKLEIGGRPYDCTHPRMGAPMEVSTAIAYSCNCFVAHFAQRFEPGELGRLLARWGLASRSGLLGGEEATSVVRLAQSRDQSALQAFGEANVMVTPVALLMAYARLAAHAPSQVLEGLEGAVEYGTAQLAQSPKIRVAGKTGTVLLLNGAKAAWFAGFAPSRKPEVAIVAVLQGRTGGLDAAPVARQIVEAHF